MSDHDSLYVAFTLGQLAEITEWAAAPQAAFDLRIATDHVYLPEVAIFTSKSRPARVRYLLNPLRDGRLVLMRPAAGHWYIPSVRAAFVEIEYRERLVSY